jgi:hypothetical protein
MDGAERVQLPGLAKGPLKQNNLEMFQKNN